MRQYRRVYAITAPIIISGSRTYKCKTRAASSRGKQPRISFVARRYLRAETGGLYVSKNAERRKNDTKAKKCCTTERCKSDDVDMYFLRYVKAICGYEYILFISACAQCTGAVMAGINSSTYCYMVKQYGSYKRPASSIGAAICPIKARAMGMKIAMSV